MSALAEIIDLTGLDDSVYISSGTDTRPVSLEPPSKKRRTRRSKRGRTPAIEVQGFDDGDSSDIVLQNSREPNVLPSKPTSQKLRNEPGPKPSKLQAPSRKGSEDKDSRRIEKQSPGKRKRSQSPAPRRRDRAKAAPIPSNDSSSLFVLDTSGGAETSRTTSSKATDGKAQGGPTNPRDGEAAYVLHPDGLMLPAHVSVENLADGDLSALFAEAEKTMENIDPETSFVDYQDGARVRRYWEEVAADGTVNEPKQRVIICLKCGEGGHIARECTLQICGKCGIRNEHSTLGCPMSKKCFTCGMTGHLNRDCTYVGRMQALGCERCGSSRHMSLECPSLWRIYTYISEESRSEIADHRYSAKDLALGEGGEAYIATDIWCYNCGHEGHLGDDCNGRTSLDRPDDPSAFGTYNIQTGPYSDSVTRPSSPRRHRSRRDSPMGADVGRRGKEKRMREHAERERRHRDEYEDDRDDWFGGMRSESRRRDDRSSEKDRKRKDRDRERDRGRAGGSKGPTLLARLSSPRSTNAPPRSHSGPSTFRPIHLKSGTGPRPWNVGESSNAPRGPRYRGGYGR